MLASWNVRGLNASEKQRDIVHFVNTNKMGMIGFLETKLKKEKLNRVHKQFFHQW